MTGRARPRAGVAWRIGIAGLLLGLGACASTPTLTPLRSGEVVSFVVVRAAPAGERIEIRNETLGRDTTVGAGSGMVVGGLWGLGCGPLAVLCVPLAAALGGATGTAAGALVGVTATLPDAKAAALRERLQQALQRHDLPRQLQQQVDERARRHWVLDTAAAKVVTVELQDLELGSTRDEQVRCIVRVRVTVRGSADDKVYEYVGAFGPLTVWLDAGSDVIDTHLASASQQIGSQIVAELAAR